MFQDRMDAAYQLMERLKTYKATQAVVLAIPRGGVPIGHLIATEFGWPLDIVLSKKIGYPTNKEFAIGAVSLYDRYLDAEVSVSLEYLEEETARIKQSLQNRYSLYMGNREPIDLTGKTAIIVDDGVATGNTLISTVYMIRKRKPEQITVSVPVAAPRAIAKLRDLVEDIICLLVPEDFIAVSQFYENFNQVTDEEVIHLLQNQ